MAGPKLQSQSNTAKASGGLLPISVVTAASNASTAPTALKESQVKPTQQKLKIIIRRLPPGLTAEELDTALGDDWQIGRGKVSWKSFKSGKVSKDLSKPSKPARAYLQLTEQAHLDTLAVKVRDTSFADAKKTDNDPVLIGPPIVEFAPYRRIQSGRKRHDVRQGLIDQDPEFIQFLESLTIPIVKGPVVDSTEISAHGKDDAQKVTPLIQHLREKKAAKEAAKEKDKNTSSKGTKHSRHTSKNEAASEKASASVDSQKTQDTSAAPNERKKTSRNAKTDKAEGKQSKKEVISSTTNTTTTTSSAPAQASKPASTKKADVPAGTAAARMLQRDLGIKGNTRRGGTKGQQGAANTTNAAETKGTQAAATSAAASKEATTTVPTASTRPAPASPAILKREVRSPPTSSNPTTNNPNVATSAATPSASATTVSTPTPAAPAGNKKSATKQASTSRLNKANPNPTSTQAFLKHANPSQGITENLLKEVFGKFGTVNKVEIDTRKGFAYLDFSEPSGLQQAMAASPVKVAQGSVHVLERKERGGGGGGGAAATAAAAPVTATPKSTPSSTAATGASSTIAAASAVPSDKVNQSTSSSSKASATATSNASGGGSRRGPRGGNRGGRGNAARYQASQLQTQGDSITSNASSNKATTTAQSSIKDATTSGAVKPAPAQASASTTSDPVKSTAAKDGSATSIPIPTGPKAMANRNQSPSRPTQTSTNVADGSTAEADKK